MNTVIEKTTDRKYVVTDYASTLGEFKKLNDARSCMKKRGAGYMCAIEAVTTEVIKIHTSQYIQHLP